MASWDQLEFDLTLDDVERRLGAGGAALNTPRARSGRASDAARAKVKNQRRREQRQLAA
jgi:hypothetical protein